MSDILNQYRQHCKERADLKIPPLPLNAQQTAEVVELLKNPPAEQRDELLDLLSNRIPPGVDEAAYIKAGFLSAIASAKVNSECISRAQAIKLLGTMQGGYNISTLVELLDDSRVAELAAAELKITLLMFDAFHDVTERAKKGNKAALSTVQSWAAAEWFTRRQPVPPMHYSDRLQGSWRNQHRRSVTGSGCLVTARYSPACAEYVQSAPAGGEPRSRSDCRIKKIRLSGGVDRRCAGNGVVP